MFDSISFLRVIKTGFLNFWRNLWLSAAATMVMTITLIIFSVIFLLFSLTNISLKSVKETVDISAYFKFAAQEDQINVVRNNLQNDPRVKEVEYISAQQGFEDFKARHKNDPNIVQSLNELDSNPIPATLHVKAKNLEDYPAIASELQDQAYQPIIDKVNYEDNRVVIDRLNKILKFIVSSGMALVAVFSLIAILVIYNTLTLTFYNRREEIEIMRLVGATNWYIRGPFLTETLLYSLFSTLITAVLLIPIFTVVVAAVLRYLFPGNDIHSYLSPAIPAQFGQMFNYWYLVFILFFISIIISAVSTLLATRKYLKI